MQFGAFPFDDTGLLGAKLAHRIVLQNGEKFSKGIILTADNIAALEQGGTETVTAAILEAGDIWEDEAAELLAKAFGGKNIRIGKAATGRVNLYAKCDGILTFERSKFLAFNAVDQRITCAALKPFERVKKGQMIATIKIIPFGVPKVVCDNAIAALNGSSFDIHAFDQNLKIGLVQTKVVDTLDKVLDKTERVTADRLREFGLKTASGERSAHTTRALIEYLSRETAKHDIIIIFGASAICDVADVVPQAIVHAGGKVDYLGMPVDPGNLILLGHIGETTIIGAPGCARSPKLNGFDWVLERACAGLTLTKQDIIDMSIGGLLTEIPSRPSPRDRS